MCKIYSVEFLNNLCYVRTRSRVIGSAIIAVEMKNHLSTLADVIQRLKQVITTRRANSMLMILRNQQ